MKSKQISKTKSLTPATSEKPIDQQIKENREQLEELAISLSIYMATHHLPSTIAKVNELQDRLEFRVKQYENELLKEKVGIYRECLGHVKPS